MQPDYRVIFLVLPPSILENPPLRSICYSVTRNSPLPFLRAFVILFSRIFPSPFPGISPPFLGSRAVRFIPKSLTHRDLHLEYHWLPPYQGNAETRTVSDVTKAWKAIIDINTNLGTFSDPWHRLNSDFLYVLNMGASLMYTKDKYRCVSDFGINLTALMCINPH